MDGFLRRPAVFKRVIRRYGRRGLGGLLLLAMLLVPALPTQAQAFGWFLPFGTAADDAARALAADASGVYVAGETYGALSGQTAAGSTDAFLRKYSAEGTETWTRQFGNGNQDSAGGIALDGGAVYVVGSTYGALADQPWAGGTDAFLHKYDADGTLVWARQFGTASTDQANAVAIGAGGIYVAGDTYRALPEQTWAGSADVFLRKYDAAGNVLWTHQFGTAGYDSAKAVAATGDAVYVAGGIAEPSAYGDAFLRKYDADGAEAWTRQFGSTADEFAYAVTVDASGVYIAGSTKGALGGQTAAGNADAFVRKYTFAGDEVWTRQFGTAGYDVAYAITIDAAAGASIQVAGRADGSLPGQTYAGGMDAFLRAYSAAGDELATHQFGVAGDDYAQALASGGDALFVAGNLPGATGDGDAFVAKLPRMTTAADPLTQLTAAVNALDLEKGTGKSLAAKLDGLANALAADKPGAEKAACGKVDAFANEVEALSGKAITVGEADHLLSLVDQVKADLDCR
ncbi:MAG: hypothetical protein ACYC1C_18625 [Chloroflexota bacterium]